MKKKLLATLLAVFMVLTMVPMAALAASETPDLGALLAAGGNVTLSENETLTANVTIPADKETTLDLGSSTLTTDGYSIIVLGKLTVTGTTGKIVNETTDENANKNSSQRPIFVVGSNENKSAELTIESGTFETATSEIVHTYGTTTIKDGTFAKKYSGKNVTIYDAKCIFVSDGEGAALTIEKGTITEQKDNVGGPEEFCGVYGVYSLRGGKVVLGTVNGNDEDLTITTDQAPLGSNNTTAPADFTVNSGTFTMTAVETNPSPTDKFNTAFYMSGTGSYKINGGTFKTVEGNTGFKALSIPYKNAGVAVDITGGTFISATHEGNENPIVFRGSKDGYGNAEGTQTVTVSGGSFSSPIPVDYLTPGLQYEAKAGSGEAVYTYHSTAEEAAKAGEVTSVNRVTAGGFNWGWKDANTNIRALLGEINDGNITYPTITSASAGKDALDQTLFFRFDNLKKSTGYFIDISADDEDFDTDSFTTGADQTNGVLRMSYATQGKASKVIKPGSELRVNLYEGVDKDTGILVGGYTFIVGLYTKPVATAEVNEEKTQVVVKIGNEEAPGSGLLGDYTIDITKGGTSVLTTPYVFGAEANETNGANRDENFGHTFTGFASEALQEGALSEGLYQVEVRVGRGEGEQTASAPLFTIPFAVGSVAKTEAPAGTTRVKLDSVDATTASFTLTNNYAPGTTFEVYADADLRTPANVTAAFAEGVLTFNFAPGAAGTYYVVATETDKLPSEATAFTVNPPYNGGSGSSGGSSSGSTTSNITVTQPANGTVTSSVTNAKEGDKVTVTVKPSKNYYVVTGVTVKGDKGTVTATKNADGTYSFTMPAGTVSVSATIVHMYDLFTDISNAVSSIPEYGTAIKWAVEQGITVGTSASTFSPYNPCTRAQMVVFLYRAAGSPAVSGTNSFTDVPSDNEIQKAVQWAVNKNITQGTSATTFDPYAPCTRAQMVTFLHRNNGEAAAAGSNSFADVPADAYYKTAIQWAVNEGITKGYSDTAFGPSDACTRVQMVTFLYRDMAK